MEQFKKFGIDDGNIEEGAIYGIASVFSLIEKEIETCLKPFNLNPTSFNALMIIKHQGKDQGISQIEIGKRLIVTASNMTKLLDKLNKEGFVQRFAQEGDRRVNLIKITQKGSDLLDQAWPGYKAKVQEITSLVDQEELEQSTNILAKWFKKLEKL
jgi:DNA-binding MarR family transcriptional regulator